MKAPTGDSDLRERTNVYSATEWRAGRGFGGYTVEVTERLVHTLKPGEVIDFGDGEYVPDVDDDRTPVRIDVGRYGTIGPEPGEVWQAVALQIGHPDLRSALWWQAPNSESIVGLEHLSGASAEREVRRLAMLRPLLRGVVKASGRPGPKGGPRYYDSPAQLRAEYVRVLASLSQDASDTTIATAMDTTPQSIRNWRSRGWLPQRRQPRRK